MVLRHKVENGVEKMNVVFYAFDNYIRPTQESPLENRIPFGD